MGRDEDSSDHDLSAFYYPALQAADIFELEIDIALGGMDQRKAHMYMREVADKYDWVKNFIGESAYKRLLLSRRKALSRGNILIDDGTANGAGQFKGEHIHFGTKKFPTWKKF